MSKEEIKTVELWEGKIVPVQRAYLINDFDFVTDLQKAGREKDFKTLVDMYFALIGDDKLIDEVREHIVEEKGFFDVEELGKILEKIQAVFPKAQSPAQKRW